MNSKTQWKCQGYSLYKCEDLLLFLCLMSYIFSPWVLDKQQAIWEMSNLIRVPPLYLCFISYSLNEGMLKSHSAGQPIVNIFVCCHFMVNKYCLRPQPLTGSSSVNITKAAVRPKQGI